MGLKMIEVKRQRVETRVVEDKWLYDTENVANAASVTNFFVTKQNKAAFLARFAGDESLVNEGRFFEWIAVELRVLADRVAAAFRPPEQDLFEMATEGFAEAKISDEVVFEENLARMFGGFDFVPVLLNTTAAAAADVRYSAGSGQHGNVRKFAVSKIVPGGRNFKLRLSWEAAGGVQLAAARRLQVAVYGIEQVPTGRLVPEKRAG